MKYLDIKYKIATLLNCSYDTDIQKIIDQSSNFVVEMIIKNMMIDLVELLDVRKREIVEIKLDILKLSIPELFSGERSNDNKIVIVDFYTLLRFYVLTILAVRMQILRETNITMSNEQLKDLVYVDDDFNYATRIMHILFDGAGSDEIADAIITLFDLF